MEVRESYGAYSPLILPRSWANEGRAVILLRLHDETYLRHF
jgi:hypothetical protein